ncbi:MAG: MFS transporter [Deltaproteobacteria bacterium]|nr:MFS transporter [Deltaproteobacteria bacterium]
MSDTPERYPRRKIFVLSSLALFTAGTSFALRGAIIADVVAELDPGSATLAGSLLGTAFLGFGTTLLLASIFLDTIGMGRALLACALCFAAGTGLAISGSGEGATGMIRAGFLLSGLGWGFMEAAVNPLTAALHPEDKTNRLNVVHAWWPAGVILGTFVALSGGAFDLGWRAQFAVVLLPAAGCVALFVGTPFPRTERASLGVSMGEMFAEIPKHPMFLVWWVCMLLTAAAELAPNQWFDFALTKSIGIRGAWIVIYVSAMMFVFRHFAGPIAHRLSNLTMLCGSAALAVLGLWILPLADSPVTGFLAATVWGIGVCFLWPTMLANVSERYPKGGELFIGLMGVAGALSIQFVLPALGAITDSVKSELAGSAAAFAALPASEQAPILQAANESAFHTLAGFVAALIVVFGVIGLSERGSARAADR